MIEAASLLRNLRYWTFHVTLSAAPSFLLARLGKWDSLEAAIAMVAGIVVFIGLFTALYSSEAFRRFAPVDGWRRRALVWGTRVRSAYAALFLLGWMLPRAVAGRAFGYLLLPDLGAGILAAHGVEAVGRSTLLRSGRIALAGPDTAAPAYDASLGHMNSLLPTFAITIVEGLLLTLELIALALVCGLILHLVAKLRTRSPQP